MNWFGGVGGMSGPRRRWQPPSVSGGPGTVAGGAVDSPGEPSRWSAHRQQESHRGKRRRPRAASERLFNRLSEEYYMRLACDLCLVHRKDTPSGSCCIVNRGSAQGHLCSEHKLLLQSKTQVKNRDNWTLIRPRPWSYDDAVAATAAEGGNLCDYATLGRPCPDGNDCVYAHSSVESDIWETVKIDLSMFIDDVRMSSLVTRSFVARVCRLHDGGFVCLCRICFFDAQQPQLVRKKQHVVAFRCGHTGTNCSLLCFQTDDGSQTIPIVAGSDAGDQANLSDVVAEYFALKRNYKVTEKEVEEESKRWKQQNRGTSANKPKTPTVQVHRFTEEDCNAPEWYPSSAREKQNRIKESGILDEYESALNLLRCEQRITDNSGFVVKDKSGRAQYYESIAGDELHRLLDENSDVYKRCLIDLKSNDTAECEIIGTNRANEEIDRIIEVRGRRNCGQCFSGDEVLVEVLVPTGSEQKVPLGKVVGALKHSIDCRSQVFVCTHLDSNLMVPMCGTAPRIRICDFLIMKKHKNMRHDLVEVYDVPFTLRHIARLPKDTSKVIFVVMLLTWNTKNALPLGYVTRILKCPETLSEELKLLNIVYQIPWLNHAEERHRKDSKKTSPAVVQVSNSCPVATVGDDFAITIDSIGTKCFDDAFTIKNGDAATEVEIGVHVTDVTERVAKGDELDNEAAQQMTEWYTSKYIPGGCPSRRLFNGVRDECSLRAGTGSKRVISVFFKANNETGELLTAPRFARFEIKIRENLDYRNVQLIINRHYADDAFVPDSVESKVIALHRVTEKMRRRRLGTTAAGFFADDKNGRLDKFADARRLVEELSLTANSQLATWLLRKVADDVAQCVPIRRQMAPGDELRASFQRRHERVIAASRFFAHPNWLPRDVEANTGDPLCRRETADELRRLSAHDPTCRHLLRESLMPVADVSYNRLVDRIVGTEILHPEHHLAMIAWFRIQHKAEYVCSSDEEEAGRRHFQLNLPVYVQFTSPLRRYLDAVVHRILKAVLDDLNVAPYDADEVVQLCRVANRLQRTKKGTKGYTEAVKELDFLETTSKDSQMLTSFVVDFDDSELVLSFPAFKQRSSDFKISYRNLSVRTLPEILEPCRPAQETGHDPATETRQAARITWEMRIYDTKPDPNGGRTKNDLMRIIDLDDGLEAGVDDRTLGRRQNSVTSEMSSGLPFVMQHVKFRMSFVPGMTIEVQLGKYATTREGRRELQIDLVSLPNRLHDFCLLHNRQPVQCLSHVTYQRSMKTYYRSLEQYRRIWLPILSMESATNAVSADPVICRNVPLRIYSSLRGNDDCSYNAHLSLEKRFCDQRKLTFLLNKCQKRFPSYERESVDDFLCIRYNPPSVEELVESPCGSEEFDRMKDEYEGLSKASKSSETTDAGKIWIAHGTVTSCALERGIIDIKCRLTHVNFYLKLNDALFRESSECRCTVEFMPKTLTDRRREAAIRKENMSQLCKDILLNRNMTKQRPIQVFGGLINHAFDGLNEEQRTAIDNARKYRFYLIHGPPGTGKTVAGVHLAHCFAQSNRMKTDDDRRQVLYCGPSNSAVDVAACKLLSEFGGSVKIIRIYNRTLERRAYPVPRDLLEASSPGETSEELLEEPNSRQHILHHRIRRPDNPHSQEIRDYDDRFREQLATPWEISNAEIEQYEGVVGKAEALEISAADVIFCTCISSASGRVARNARVRQIIIDESGMNAEPDCVVPLTSHPDVEQVVLVGDHLQLQPIAVNYAAKRLGLGRSLFERHSVSENPRVLTMLRQQYRMHDSICRFPSEYFYKGRLTTAFSPAALNPSDSGNLLWPVENQRIVFCHLEGEEENQKVATVDGNLFSKSNDLEQTHVVKIVFHLVRRCAIPMRSIAVISQYKAQCSQLRRRLAADFSSVHVSTVVASQGKEWDYVILSTVRSLSRYEIDPRPQRTWISEHLGTAADPHQINVALTRAKRGLIILGNKNLLEVCPMWKALIDDYRNKFCLMNATAFPPSS